MDMGDIVLKSADGQTLFSGKLDEFETESLSADEEIGVNAGFSIDLKRSAEFSMGLQDVNYKALEQLFMPQSPHAYGMVFDYKMPVYVQAKKHKQKRINKKWLKKYGYKVVYIHKQMRVDNCSITPTSDGQLEFNIYSKTK